MANAVPVAGGNVGVRNQAQGRHPSIPLLPAPARPSPSPSPFHPQGLFLKAKRPEGALKMYREAKLWNDALRVAEQYLPTKVGGQPHREAPCLPSSTLNPRLPSPFPGKTQVNNTPHLPCLRRRRRLHFLPFQRVPIRGSITFHHIRCNWHLPYHGNA